jgi:hypothetical protein
MISVDDEDPLGTIATLRKADNLPAQYKLGIYDNQANTTRLFVFVLNDRPDNAKA